MFEVTGEEGRQAALGTVREKQANDRTQVPKVPWEARQGRVGWKDAA